MFLGGYIFALKSVSQVGVEPENPLRSHTTTDAVEGARPGPSGRGVHPSPRLEQEVPPVAELMPPPL